MKNRNDISKMSMQNIKTLLKRLLVKTNGNNDEVFLEIIQLI